MAHIIRRFVLIQGRTLTQYVDGKKTSVWDWVDDEETREDTLETIEFVRNFVPEKK